MEDWEWTRPSLGGNRRPWLRGSRAEWPISVRVGESEGQSPPLRHPEAEAFLLIDTQMLTF